MNTTLRKCIDCGRLFAAHDGLQQCRVCAEEERTVYRKIEDAVVRDELRTVPDIALALEVDASAVRRVLAEMPYLAGQVENDALCPRCGIRPATYDREFCPVCLVQVAADLRDMATVTEKNKEHEPPPVVSRLNVKQALAEKKRRTGHYRFDPVPPNIKGNG